MCRIFIDIDGTLAHFIPCDTLEKLYEEGYFRNLPPHENVVEMTRILMSYKDVEVFVLSAYLTDSKYALKEKNEWLDKYLPELDAEHRIFMPCGEDKSKYIPGGVRPTDVLFDDYTKNLKEWAVRARAVKLLNGINYSNRTWKGDRLTIERTGSALTDALYNITVLRQRYFDNPPQRKERPGKGILEWIDVTREE